MAQVGLLAAFVQLLTVGVTTWHLVSHQLLGEEEVGDSPCFTESLEE